MAVTIASGAAGFVKPYLIEGAVPADRLEVGRCFANQAQRPDNKEGMALDGWRWILPSVHRVVP